MTPERESVERYIKWAAGYNADCILRHEQRMALEQRAKAAATFLNAGDQWRAYHLTLALPQAKDFGWWLLSPTNKPESKYTFDCAELIDLALAEGWTGLDEEPA